MTAMRKAAMVAVTMFLLAAGRPADAATPEAAIGEAFVAARSALMAQNGEAVIDLLSQDTRRRVERMRTAALGGAMGGLSPSEKFGALGLQRFLKPAELKKMDAAQLVEYGLRKGWLGPNLIAGSGLDKVSIRGDRATGILTVNQKPALLPAEFVREGGQWRFDLSRALEFSDALMRGTAMATKRSEDEVVRDILERAINGEGRPPQTR
jgi:hypothetical protein